MSMSTGIPKAVSSNVLKWTLKVAELLEEYSTTFFKEYVKVAYVIEQLAADNPEFRGFSYIYQRGLIGRCLKQLDYVKYSRTPQGYVYVHKNRRKR